VRDLITKLTLDGRYTYVSRACQPILGYSPAELLGQSFYRLIHPDDLAEIKVMDPPLLHPTNEDPFTLRFKRKDGSFVWLESSIKGVKGSDPDDVELVAVARDVTERKRYEVALQTAYDNLEKRVDERTAELTKSNKLLKQVIEERKQAEAKIIQFNQELLALQYAGAAIASSLDLQYVLGTVTREMVEMLKIEGCAISEWNEDDGAISLLTKHGPKEWWCAGALTRPEFVQEILATREYREIKADQLEGDIKTLLIMPLVFQDREVGCIEIADSRVERHFTNQEISLVQLLASHAASAIENARLYQKAQQEIAERKKAEIALEQERAMLARRVDERTAELSAANAKLSRAARLKDEFLASMSHELRTPLNAVLSMSEALQEEVYGPLNEKQTKTLKNIGESGRHLLSLINDILDLSKIEAGKLDLQVDVVSVEQVGRASLLFVKQLAHKKQIRVQANFDNQVSTIKADERRLKQVLVNLLSNAVKFTPEGGQIGLDVTADPEQQAVHFVVSDTGIGIPRDQIERLFQPFVQLDSKLSRRYAGTGLGLALVRRMAEMHGGSISVESEEGRGSQFTVSLPWQRNFQAQPSAQPETKTSVRRALIIEDSVVVTEQYQRYLEQAGMTVTIRHEGVGAVETVINTKPDVILLDLMLPDRSGWDILTDLKANPQTGHIPVVVASVMDEKAQAQALGADDYLVKPISRRQLAETLKQVCSNVSPTAPPTAKPTSLDKKPARQPHILLAEDNEINLRTVSDYLGRSGFRVTPARTGFEAIQRAEEETPSIILMDIQMPEMDGLEATQRLRRNQQFQSVPIIALTALAMPGDRERCLQAGANDYISKPISLKNLVQSINLQLENHPTNRG
jgi:PAS domain S-box-containing protein